MTNLRSTPKQTTCKQPQKKRKQPSIYEKKDALNQRSMHPIIFKLSEYYFLKKSFTASLATIRSSNT